MGGVEDGWVNEGGDYFVGWFIICVIVFLLVLSFFLLSTFLFLLSSEHSTRQGSFRLFRVFPFMIP